MSIAPAGVQLSLTAGAGNPTMASPVRRGVTGAETLRLTSVAAHVRVTVDLPPQAPAVVESLEGITRAGSQLSVAVGAVKTGEAGQLMLVLAPWPLRTGLVVSW